MKEDKNGWTWVPTLYFAEGIPYIIIMTTSVIMFNKMGLSNSNNALYTSWLYIPWVIKPLWSPLVDLFKTKKWWIITMQLLIGAGFACIALFLPATNSIRYSLIFMWLIAFSSATHDIAADGFYMLALKEDKQAYFIGIRNTFYRIAMITGQGLLVVVAGYFENVFSKTLPQEDAITQSWVIVFYVLAVLFGILFIYHNFILPKCETNRSKYKKDENKSNNNLIIENSATKNTININNIDNHSSNRKMEKGTNKESSSLKELILSFFLKPYILISLLFILFYRFSESQLAKIASPFLLDPINKGGLGLETSTVGIIYGTIGVLALVIGGILGGIAISKKGLKYWLWSMALFMNLPNFVYIWLSQIQPHSIYAISTCVAIEQFGYGFGFSALAYFMMLFSRGKYQTSHYALCTGFMALGMMIPGMFSGYIQENIGYQCFFFWIALCTIPSFIVTYFAAHIKNFK